MEEKVSIDLLTRSDLCECVRLCEFKRRVSGRKVEDKAQRGREK